MGFKWLHNNLSTTWYDLTHWGRVMHICVIKLIIIGSDNGLSPGRRQAIIWTNTGILYIKGRLKSIARSTSVRCMELHDRKWCVEASNLKISVLPIVTRYVTIDTTHGCLGLIRQPHPRVIVMTGRASLVSECKQMTEWSSSESSCGCRAVSGIPIPNSHHQVH